MYWQHKGELFLAQWAHETSGHQRRDTTYKWARDQGMDLTMDAIAQVIHDCETCAIIKEAKRMKSLREEGRWQKYKYGEAWQVDSITLPQSQMVSIMCLWQQLGGLKHMQYPMLLPKTSC